MQMIENAIAAILGRPFTEDTSSLRVQSPNNYRYRFRTICEMIRKDRRSPHSTDMPTQSIQIGATRSDGPVRQVLATVESEQRIFGAVIQKIRASASFGRALQPGSPGNWLSCGRPFWMVENRGDRSDQAI